MKTSCKQIKAATEKVSKMECEKDSLFWPLHFKWQGVECDIIPSLDGLVLALTRLLRVAGLCISHS